MRCGTSFAIGGLCKSLQAFASRSNNRVCGSLGRPTADPSLRFGMTAVFEDCGRITAPAELTSAGAKARLILQALLARLKPCPKKKLNRTVAVPRFVVSHSSSKKRSMNGAQFRPWRIGNAGGGLVTKPLCLCLNELFAACGD